MKSIAQARGRFREAETSIPRTATGKITFRCLIKRGPANVGEFHYPIHPLSKGDLTLNEAAASTQVWFKSKEGESCDELCASKSQYCDMAKIKAAQQTLLQFEASIGKEHLCTLPLLSDSLGQANDRCPPMSNDRFPQGRRQRAQCLHRLYKKTRKQHPHTSTALTMCADVCCRGGWGA